MADDQGKSGEAKVGKDAREPQGGEVIDLTQKKAKSQTKMDKEKVRVRSKAMQRLLDRRTRINITEGTKAAREKLRERLEQENKEFFERILGKGMAATLLCTLFSPFSKLGKWIKGDEKALDMKKFTESIDAREIEKILVAHRAMGYERGLFKKGENTKNAIDTAIEGGETELEIDLRMAKTSEGKMEIFLAHDKIKENDPENHYTRLVDVIDLFAKNKNLVIFFDVKEESVLTHLDIMIAEADKRQGNEKDTEDESLANRHFISSFDPEILRKSRETNKNRPVIFSYFPICSLPGEDMLAKSSKKGYGRIAKIIDTFTKGKTKLAEDVDRTTIYVEGQAVKGSDEKKEEAVINIYKELPDSSIMQMLRECNGFLCVPAPLATETLVQHAHEQGVRVAVWDAEGLEMQKAIAFLNVDLVITNEPDITPGKVEDLPKEQYWQKAA